MSRLDSFWTEPAKAGGAALDEFWTGQTPKGMRRSARETRSMANLATLARTMPSAGPVVPRGTATKRGRSEPAQVAQGRDLTDVTRADMAPVMPTGSPPTGARWTPESTEKAREFAGEVGAPIESAVSPDQWRAMGIRTRDFVQTFAKGLGGEYRRAGEAVQGKDLSAETREQQGVEPSVVQRAVGRSLEAIGRWIEPDDFEAIHEANQQAIAEAMAKLPAQAEEPYSPAWFVTEAIQSSPSLGGGIAIGVVTRSPTAGLLAAGLIEGGGVAAATYDIAREQGKSDEQAAEDAYYAMLTHLPTALYVERFALGEILGAKGPLGRAATRAFGDGAGAGIAGRTAGSAVAGAAEESIQTASEEVSAAGQTGTGIEPGLLERMQQSAAVGAVLEGTAGGVMATAQRITNEATRKQVEEMARKTAEQREMALQALRSITTGQAETAQREGEEARERLIEQRRQEIPAEREAKREAASTRREETQQRVKERRRRRVEAATARRPAERRRARDEHEDARKATQRRMLARQAERKRALGSAIPDRRLTDGTPLFDDEARATKYASVTGGTVTDMAPRGAEPGPWAVIKERRDEGQEVAEGQARQAAGEAGQAQEQGAAVEPEVLTGEPTATGQVAMPGMTAEAEREETIDSAPVRLAAELGPEAGQVKGLAALQTLDEMDRQAARLAEKLREEEETEPLTKDLDEAAQAVLDTMEDEAASGALAQTGTVEEAITTRLSALMGQEGATDAEAEQATEGQPEDQAREGAEVPAEPADQARQERGRDEGAAEAVEPAAPAGPEVTPAGMTEAPAGAALTIEQQADQAAEDAAQRYQAKIGRPVSPDVVMGVMESARRRFIRQRTEAAVEDLMGRSRDELRGLARDLGVGVSGTKKRIAERIAAAQTERPRGGTDAEAVPEAQEQAREDEGGAGEAGEGAEAQVEPRTVAQRAEDWADRTIERVEQRQKERGTRLKTGIDPDEVADLALWTAANIVKGTVRTMKAARALIQSTFNRELTNKEAREVWKLAREQTEIMQGVLDDPEPMQAVETRLKERTKTGRVKAGHTRETKLIARAFNAGLKEAEAKIAEIRADIRSRVQARERATADVVQGIREEIRRLVESTTPVVSEDGKVSRVAILPMRDRGAFLSDLTNAKGYADLRRSINKLRHLIARSRARAIGRDLKRLGDQDHVKRITQVGDVTIDRTDVLPMPEGQRPRERYRALLDEARRLHAQFRGGGRFGARDTRAASMTETVNAMEAELSKLEKLHREIAEMFAIAQAEARQIRDIRGYTRSIIAKRAAARIRGAKPSSGEERRARQDIERLDPSSSLGRRAKGMASNGRTFWHRLEGGWNEADLMHATTYERLTRLEEDERREFYGMLDEFDQLARDSGYDSLADLMDRAGRHLGTGRMQTFDAVLGGRRVRLTLGNVMKIAAYLEDADTVAQFAKGRRIKLEGGRGTEALRPSLRELRDIADMLPDEARGFLHEARRMREDRLRDRTFDTFRRRKGYEPDMIPGHEHRSVDRETTERFEFDHIARGSVKYLENQGFMKDRTGGGAPIVIGDFMTDLVESVENMLGLIYYSEAIADAAAILTHEDVRTAITRTHGKQEYRRAQKMLLHYSGANRELVSTVAKIASWLNQTAAIKYLGPASWARQWGSIARLAAHLDGAELAAGVAALPRISHHAMIERGGYFSDRYRRTAAARQSFGQEQETQAQAGFRQLMDGLDRLVANAFQSPTKASGVERIKQTYNQLRRGASTPLLLLNYFDGFSSRIALGAMEHRAKKALPDATEAERERWIVQEATSLVRRVQNASSRFDMPFYGLEARDTAASLLTLFTSDPAVSHNDLIESIHEGKEKGAKRVAAEVLNVAWSRAVGVGWLFGSGWLLWLLAGGDEEDLDELKRRSLSLEKNLVQAARELIGVSVPVAPVGEAGLSPILSVLQRTGVLSDDLWYLREPELVNVPAESLITDALDAVSRVAESHAGDDETERVLIRWGQLLNEALSAAGVNPMWSPINRMARDLDKTLEQGGGGRRGRRRRSRTRRRQR